MLTCPQCGRCVGSLHEGYCLECRDENQRQLDEHNATLDWWKSLTVAEREAVIRKAKAGTGGSWR